MEGHVALPIQVIGWAIKNNGVLLVQTVGATKMAAYVNFLFANVRLAIGDRVSDATVEKLWRAHKGEAEAVRVSIEEMPGAVTKSKRRSAA